MIATSAVDPPVVVGFGLAVTGGAVVVALVALGVPLSKRAVIAFVPWSVTAGMVPHLATTGLYEPYTVLLTMPVSVLVVATVAGVSWLFGLLLAAIRGRSNCEGYLASSGIGTLLAVSTGVFYSAPTVTATGVVWFLVTPIAAALVAALGYFVLGLVYTVPLVTLRFTGLFVVFATTVDGVTATIASAVFGRGETVGVSGVLRWGMETTGVSEMAWSYAVGTLVFGLVSVAFCGRLTERSPSLSNALALTVIVATLTPATYALVSVTLGG